MSIFTSTILTPPLRGLASVFLRVAGWTCENERPAADRYVAVMAPHTSNWDFLYFLAAGLVFRLDVRWLGKDTLFAGPLGPIMKWLGGVPVNRGEAKDIVPDAVAFLRSGEKAALAIAPEAHDPAWRAGRRGFTA